ncbi:hypothetical protein FJM67_10670 [Maribrevibacterium harenarium]|uniref:Outer membrane protein beta-barrel domain-containing protein n=1 Tax=Maribrevibacterium harenarium TaxID=2589817 RepID=A0A501WKC6_9GAMM|nr:hypothetical protein [Maribrevibacterium harenarium]TPE50303.1 hypothetical protein FJM67_10670 [Maribrevibacterium harenarium]
MKKILLPIALLSSSVAFAEINNEPYTYLGVAAGQFAYKESGTVTGGIKFETTPTNFQVFNYSGGYTAVGERTGFYINTVSTLYASTDAESWQFSSANGSGEHQKNQVTSNHNSLDILFGYLFEGGHQLVIGGAYRRTLMDRNGFSKGADAGTFNSARWKGENTALNEADYISKYGLQDEFKVVNYTETFTSALAQVGYRYDTRFKSSEVGPRWQWGATIGLPLFYDVVNTSNSGLSFSSSFEGFDVGAYVGYGWRFTENLGLLAKANYFYRLRNEMRIRGDYVSELNRYRYAIIPENEVQYWNVGVNGYWNF